MENNTIKNINKNQIMGLDLGSSEIKISFFNKEGNISYLNLQSIIYLDENRNIYFGEEARKKRFLNFESTLFNIRDNLFLKENFFLKKFHLSPIQILSKLLDYIKELLEKSHEINPKYVILSIPTNYSENEKIIIEKSLSLSSLKILRIITEPVSTAISFGFNRIIENNKILILDFGFGSFDFSALDSKNGLINFVHFKNIEHLGGKYWDQVFCDFLIKEIYEQHKIELTNNHVIISQLLKEIKKIRNQFSEKKDIFINLKNIAINHDGNPVDFNLKISQIKILEIYSSLIKSFKNEFKDFIIKTDLNTKDINYVLLVGGFSEIFKNDEILNEMFEDDINKFLFGDINSISKGNLIQGLMIIQNLNNDFSLSVRLFDKKDFVLIQENFSIPFSVENYFSTTRDYQKNIFLEFFKTYSFAPEFNRRIGELWIKNIKRNKSGIPTIKLNILLNIDGILNISATNENEEVLLNDSINFLDKF